MRRFLILFLMCLLTTGAMAQATLRQGFVRQQVLEGPNMPVGITFDETGRGYLWTKSGVVWLIEDGALLPTPLIDLSEEISNTGDNGMLGFVLHPDFRKNGYFYLFYTVDRHHLDHFGLSTYDPEKNRFWAATIARLTRFTADQATGFATTVAGSRKVLLGHSKADGPPVMFVSHGAADLAFGEDGTLLVAPGDGAPWTGPSNGSGNPWYGFEAEGIVNGFYPETHNVGSFRSQLLESSAGKVLRIDPETGDGVPGNPYFDPQYPASTRSRIWGLGLRNPFRMAVRPGTGEADPATGRPGTLYIGDVSGGYWEEINVQRTGGKNFGWPLYDDDEPHASFQRIDTFNQFALNPLAGQNGCPEYFRFGDLLKPAGVPFVNPCDSSQLIPADIPTFTLQQANLRWYHQSSSRPPTFSMLGASDSGLPMAVDIEDPASGVTGDLESAYGNAVVGGVFYDGFAFPEEYRGAYFLADHLGWIKAFHFNLNDSLVRVDHFWQDSTRIVDLAVNPDDGCLYVLHYPQGLYRICYGLNLPPFAVIETDQHYGPGPLEVQFDASKSYDPDQDPFTFLWEFGDGSTSTNISPRHTFSSSTGLPQAFDVILTLTDTAGHVSKESVLISLNNTPPVVSILSPQDGALLPQKGPTMLWLEAAVSDQEEPESALRYAWKEILHHNTHSHEQPADSLIRGDLVVSELDCGPETYYYEIRLEVQDGFGLSGEDRVYLYPDCVEEFAGLESLEVSGDLGGVTISWNFAWTEDLDAVEIQWSQDGIGFRTIGTVAGVRSFLHENPAEGSNHYRLRLLNQHGQSYYSHPESIYLLEGGFRLYPNPSTGTISIEADATTGNAISISLFDLRGQELLTETWESGAGGSGYNTSVGHLADGMYVYRITDGSAAATGKLVLRRD